MANLQAFRDIANNTSVSDRRYVYYIDYQVEAGDLEVNTSSLCFNAAGKPRQFMRPPEDVRKFEWANMRWQLRNLVADKLDMQSETFKKIETVLFGKLVNGEVDQKELEKPLRKRDIVKVFSLMDKTLNDEVDRNYLKSHLFDQVSRSLDSFLSVEADNVFDEEYRHPDFTLVPKGRRGEAKRILANLVNKAASKPMPLSAAEIAKLKKQFIADFKKAGFLNEKPGCEKTVYSYHFKKFTGQAAVKWKMVNSLFDDQLALDFGRFDLTTVQGDLNARRTSRLADHLAALKTIASFAFGKHEGANGGNGYMGLTSDGHFVKFLTRSKERKAFADSKESLGRDMFKFVENATNDLRNKLLGIAEYIDEGLKNRLEGILKEERIRGVPLLSRASVAKALDEISKSFVGAYNVAFNWDDVVHAATFPDSSLEGVFRLYSPKASS